MSKVGKRAFLLLLAIPIVINVMAQETKKPTLEDLIPGGESYRYAETTIAARTGFLHRGNSRRPESVLPASVFWFLVP